MEPCIVVSSGINTQTCLVTLQTESIVQTTVTVTYCLACSRVAYVTLTTAVSLSVLTERKTAKTDCHYNTYTFYSSVTDKHLYSISSGITENMVPVFYFLTLYNTTHTSINLQSALEAHYLIYY